MFQGRSVVARMMSLTVAGGACLALAACGPSGSAPGAAASSPAPARTADPLANLTAAQVGAKAIADARAASSLTMAGAMSQSIGTMNVNLAISPAQRCAGTVTVAGKGSFKIVVIGSTVYLNLDDQFWKSFAGSAASAVIGLVNGKWLKSATSDKNVSPISGICDVSQLFSSNGVPDKLTKGKVTTLNGTRVLALDAPQGVAYVTDTSKPEVVELVSPKGSGKLTVTYDTPVTLTAPPSSDVLNGSQLGF